MKKTFVLLMLSVFTLSIGFAQNERAKDVPHTKKAKKQKTPEEKAYKIVKKFGSFLIKKEVQPLNDAQAENLKRTYLEGYAQIAEARAKANANPPADTMTPNKKKGNPEIRAIKKAMKVRIKSILTPEQYEGYTAFMKRKKGKGKNGQGKKGGKKGKAMMTPDAPQN